MNPVGRNVKSAAKHVEGRDEIRFLTPYSQGWFNRADSAFWSMWQPVQNAFVVVVSGGDGNFCPQLFGVRVLRDNLLATNL